MNILILTYQGQLQGSTNSIRWLCEGLAQRGHRVVLGCRQESLLYKMLKGSNVILEPMTWKSKWDKENMRHIRDVVLKYNIQLINAQSSKDRYTSIFARWKYKLPCILVHTRRQTPKSALGRLQNWFYTKGTDKIITNSKQLKQTFVRKGIPADHIHVIFNGIPAAFFEQYDAQKVDALYEEYDLKPKNKIIGCFSRPKKQDQLIKAMKLLPKEVILLLAGVEVGYYDALIQSIDLPNRVVYTGKVAPEDIVNYYGMLDTFVLPSMMDGFGLVLVEAMGNGVPVIGTRHEGIIDVLGDGKYGKLFENENIEQLAEHLHTMLFDEVVRKHYMEQGMKAAHEVFTLERTIDEYERYFQELIDGKA